MAHPATLNKADNPHSNPADLHQQYKAFLIDSLESQLGTDFGLTQMPGFLSSVNYVQQMTSPRGFYFNYSDTGLSSLRIMPPVAFGWFAQRMNRPDLLLKREEILKEHLEKKKVDLWNKKQDSQRWDVFRIGPFSHNI